MTAPTAQGGRIPRLPDDHTRAAAEEWVDARERSGRNRP